MKRDRRRPYANDTCRYCGAAIRFVKTSRGKYMPVDLESVQEGHEEYWDGSQTPHFATCPHGEKAQNQKKNEDDNQLTIPGVPVDGAHFGGTK